MYVKTLCVFGRKCEEGFVYKLSSERFLYYRPNWRDLWTCNGDAHEAAAQRKYGVWRGDKWQTPIKESAFYSSHTRIELQAADATGLERCWAAGS